MQTLFSRAAFLRHFARAVCVILGAVALAVNAADEPAKTSFDIPASTAEKSLKQFSEQSGAGVVFVTDAVKDVQTQAVKGEYAIKEALDQLLAGTPLEVTQDDKTGAFAIRRKRPDEPKNADSRPTSSPTVSSDPGRSAVPASTPTDEAILLPTFSVAGKTETGYRTNEVVSVSRIAGDVLTSPLTVNVVTPQLISDLGANAAYDVTRYFSGVSNGRGTGSGGIGDRHDFRGFENFYRSIDDFSSALLPLSSAPQGNWDPAFIERAELVMGPDSILSPTGSPGGSINIITKSPSFAPSITLSQSVGNYNAGKTTVDSTGPIGDGNHWAYRIIADYQDAKEFVPGSLRQSNASVQLTYSISPTSKLSLKYFGEDWELTGAIADTNDNGEMVYTPDTVGGTISNTPQPGFVYQGWNGDASWGHRFDRFNIGQAEFTTTLFDKISVRLGAQIVLDNFTQDAGYPSGTVKETFNSATGEVTTLTPTFTVANGVITSMPEVAYFSHQEYRGEQLQNDYAANFHPGPVSLQPVAGWSYIQGTTPLYLTSSDPSMPAANLSVGPYGVPHPSFSSYTFASNTPAFGVQEQLYGALRAGFLSDKLLVSVGVSRTWDYLDEYSTKIGSGVSATGPYTLLPLDSQRDNYLAGALYRITEGISAYYSYSTNAAVTTNTFKQPVWQSGKQHEFGLKGEFLDNRLLVSVAHFQISESNLTSTNPLYNLNPTTQPPVLIYDAVNHGFELNVVGNLTNDLSVILSATEMDYRDTYGRRYRNVPDQLANLLLNYHFSTGALKDLSIFAGLVHVGQTAGESVTAFTSTGVPEQPSFFVPSWTAVNAGASYRWSRYKLNLNVDNALNEQFWWQPAGRNSVSPYPGLTVRLTAMIKI